MGLGKGEWDWGRENGIGLGKWGGSRGGGGGGSLLARVEKVVQERDGEGVVEGVWDWGQRGRRERESFKSV